MTAERSASSAGGGGDEPKTTSPWPGWEVARDWLKDVGVKVARSLPALIVLLAVFGGLLGILVAALSSDRYTAHAYLLVTTTGSGADVSAVNTAQAVARVATSESVLSADGSNARLLDATRDKDLTATSSPDAPLVDLAATSSSPSDAADLADEFAQQVETHVSEFRDVAQIRAEVFAPASLPRDRSSPNALVDLVAGVALGLLAGAVLYVVRRS